MDRVKAIDKIKKCLRLSRSSNANEAAAALRQAQALMSQHGVELADVEASEIREVAARSGATRAPAAWEIWLGNMVKGCFACDAIFSGGWDHGEWRFIGSGANPEIAAYAFAVLLRQIRLARTQYVVTALRRCKQATKRQRADAFCRGWIGAASDKTAELKPSPEEARAIELFLENKYPETRSMKGRGSNRRGRFDDLARGFEEGEKAQLRHGVDRATQQLLEVKS